MQVDFFIATYKHIRTVQDYIVAVCRLIDDDFNYHSYIYPIVSEFPGRKDQLREMLLYRAVYHDCSKFDDNEIYGYEDIILKGEATEEFKKAVSCHYEKNDHHPEHFENWLTEMSGDAVLEMLCDWISASERSGIYNSPFDFLPIAQKRFGITKNMITDIRNLYEVLGVE